MFGLGLSIKNSRLELGREIRQTAHFWTPKLLRENPRRALKAELRAGFRFRLRRWSLSMLFVDGAEEFDFFCIVFTKVKSLLLHTFLKVLWSSLVNARY